MSIGSNAKLYRPKDVPYIGAGVVFTNGCFDILHAGHVKFLQRAKQFGEKLIVAVNSDGSVRMLKGSARPVNVFKDRVDVVAALSCVDAVTWFDGTHCGELIRMLHPHCWVKAGYTMQTLNPDEVREAKDGGTAIILLEKFGDYSTTGIIERMRA